jgi:hypothetical protein
MVKVKKGSVVVGGTFASTAVCGMHSGNAGALSPCFQKQYNLATSRVFFGQNAINEAGGIEKVLAL